MSHGSKVRVAIGMIGWDLDWSQFLKNYEMIDTVGIQ